MQYQFEYDLYAFRGRAFEDCKAKVTVGVPENYQEFCPKKDEVELLAVSVDADTAAYLEDTFNTDMKALVLDIKSHLEHIIYDEFIEHYGEAEIPDEEVYEAWFATATPRAPGKPIEIINAQALFGGGPDE